MAAIKSNNKKSTYEISRSSINSALFDAKDIFKFIEDKELFGRPEIAAAFAPVRLENLIYFLGCLDIDLYGLAEIKTHQPITKLIPSWADNEFEPPIKRFFSGILAERGLENDKKLAEFLYPRWEIDNAEREIKRIRQKKTITWNRIGIWSSEIEDVRTLNLFRSICYVNIFQSMFNVIQEHKPHIPYLNQKEFWEAVPNILERSVSDIQSSSQSSGRSSSPLDCQ